MLLLIVSGIAVNLATLTLKKFTEAATLENSGPINSPPP